MTCWTSSCLRRSDGTHVPVPAGTHAWPMPDSTGCGPISTNVSNPSSCKVAMPRAKSTGAMTWRTQYAGSASSPPARLAGDVRDHAPWGGW